MIPVRSRRSVNRWKNHLPWPWKSVISILLHTLHAGDDNGNCWHGVDEDRVRSRLEVPDKSSLSLPNVMRWLMRLHSHRKWRSPVQAHCRSPYLTKLTTFGLVIRHWVQLHLFVQFTIKLKHIGLGYHTSEHRCEASLNVALDALIRIYWVGTRTPCRLQLAVPATLL